MSALLSTTTSKLILGLAVILIAIFQYRFWLGDGGYFHHQDVVAQIQQQNDSILELKERNRIIAAEVYDLKNGVEATEEHARLDLGLIKPHETFIQMSTISTHYNSIQIDPNTPVDYRTNEQDVEPLPEKL